MKKHIVIPVALAALASTPSLKSAEVDFARDIQPILEARCIQCHGPEKQKGKLRLDSKEATLAGGKDGVVIVAGDAGKSDFFRRVSLPKGNDDVMPAEGDPLTQAQIDLVKEWINQGAKWPDGLVLKAAAAAAPSAPTAAPRAAPARPGIPLPTDFKPGPGEPKAIAALAKIGVEVHPIAMNVPWTEANFRLQGTNITDAALPSLKELPSLVDLNLASTRITDAGLNHVRSLTNLQTLHLELTGVTDAGLVHLKNLTRLSYLNLYGTKVTDAGLEQLKGLPSLAHLYVWQSKATAAGASNLQQALPGLEVILGWDLAAATNKTEAPAAKPEETKK
jgi:mono/diheme cytochrome c family protein